MSFPPAGQPSNRPVGRVKREVAKKTEPSVASKPRSARRVRQRGPSRRRVTLRVTGKFPSPERCGVIYRTGSEYTPAPFTPNPSERSHGEQASSGTRTPRYIDGGRLGGRMFFQQFVESCGGQRSQWEQQQQQWRGRKREQRRRGARQRNFGRRGRRQSARAPRRQHDCQEGDADLASSGRGRQSRLVLRVRGPS